MMIFMENIVKFYDNGVKTEVLKGLSLSVKDGEFISIVGKSGSGKTTLLNIIGCMDTFNNGTYLIDGKNMAELSQKQMASFRNKQIGFVFQSFNLIDDMTVMENTELPLGYSGYSKKERRKKVLSLLEQMGIPDKMRNYPYQLSGGEKQRVAIARALTNDPAFILADEPTGNLDSQTSEQIINIFHSLHKAGKTVVLITHEHSIADKADRIVKIHDGMVEG